MSTRPLPPALAALLLASLPLAAQEPPADPSGGGRGSRRPPARHVVSGEIMDVEKGGVKIRPYDVRLPKRVEVTLNEGTRLFHQRKGKVEEIQRGDMVLVLEDLEPPKKGPADLLETPEEDAAPGPAEVGSPSEDGGAEAGPQRKVLKAKAVVRLWTAPEVRVEEADIRTARALYQNALPMIMPGGKTARRKWEKERTRIVVGVVTRLNPLVLHTVDRSRRFEFDRKMPVVSGTPITAKALDRGESVTVQSAGGLTSDGKLAATMLVVGPKPPISGEHHRKILMRDQGKNYR